MHNQLGLIVHHLHDCTSSNRHVMPPLLPCVIYGHTHQCVLLLSIQMDLWLDRVRRRNHRRLTLSEKVEGHYPPSSQNAFAFWPGIASYSLALSLREAHRQSKTRLRSVGMWVLSTIWNLLLWLRCQHLTHCLPQKCHPLCQFGTCRCLLGQCLTGHLWLWCAWFSSSGIVLVGGVSYQGRPTRWGAPRQGLPVRPSSCFAEVCCDKLECKALIIEWKNVCMPYLRYLCQCRSLHPQAHPQAGEGWYVCCLGNGRTWCPLHLWVGHFRQVHTGRVLVEKAYRRTSVILSESEDKTVPVEPWPHANVFCAKVRTWPQCHRSQWDVPIPQMDVWWQGGAAVVCHELVTQEQFKRGEDRGLQMPAFDKARCGSL